MNQLDKQYTDLLQTILDYGVEKKDRTGTGTKSIFGYTIRHNMKDGFPLLTTKKMPFRLIATELIWFLRGDTNIKFLVDNDCHIWDGDAYKKFHQAFPETEMLSKEHFIQHIKNDGEFAKKWGDLGPTYGKQWRSWCGFQQVPSSWHHGAITHFKELPKCDQIANLIHDLKTNPDSRRLMVSAWNVGELDHMTLPPCHYGFQVYTRELSLDERNKWSWDNWGITCEMESVLDEQEVPKRAISLMWNQRSVDTFLGLPFNIASYGLLLEIIAKVVNMVPDELIGNLGDTHLYLNHIEQAKEQVGREMDLDERKEYSKNPVIYQDINGATWSSVMGLEALTDDHKKELHNILDEENIPKRTREPYPLPTLNINTEFWPYEGGSCGEGPLDAIKVFESFKDENFCRCLLEEDIQLGNYQSHPSIKAPLSN